MMRANAHASKKFTRMCFEKSEVTSAEKKEKSSCEQAPHSLLLSHPCLVILAQCV